MAEPPHCVVDDFVGVFGALLSEVKIDHGGLQLGMSHVALDEAGIDPFFQEVRGIAVPEGVNGDMPLFDTGSESGPAECTLDALDSHGLFGCWGYVVAPASCREKQERVSVGEPIASKQYQNVLGQGDETILCTFTAMNMDQQPVAVDIGDLKAQRF